MNSNKRLLRSTNARMITMNAFITLELLFQHDETIKIIRETELTKKEDRNVVELNLFCDFQMI